jgi:hypothetical protein
VQWSASPPESDQAVELLVEWASCREVGDERRERDSAPGP